VCSKHTAKAILHSAKNARRTVHRQQHLCRVLFVGHSAKTLPSAGKEKSPSRRQVTVTDPLPSAYGDTRQRLVQWTPQPVPVPRALVGTRQRRFLCRVSGGLALDKEPSSGPLCQYLCRVPWQKHSAKMSLPVPRFPSLPSAAVSTRQRWLYRFPGFLLCRVPWS
jgi:hypothetical protein